MMRIALIVLMLAYSTAAQEAPCEVTPLSVSFQHFGGAADVTVTGDRVWVAAPIQSWITVPMSTSGEGPGMFTIAVPPNTGPARTGYLRVGGRLVTVTQKKGPGKK